jgi:transcription antitermination factor NusG
MQATAMIAVPDISVLPWWALYTRHQHEKTVAEMLSAKGFEVFLPLYQSVRHWKDRRKVISLPLFPGYVFVRGGQRRLQIVSTPGIHMILTHGDRDATIAEEEIDAIRRMLESSFRVEPHPFLRGGDRVRVKSGTLEGIEGILIRWKGSARLVLSVDMLAQSVGVEIDAENVEPVTSRIAPTFGRMNEIRPATLPLPPARERWMTYAGAPRTAAQAG